MKRLKKIYAFYLLFLLVSSSVKSYGQSYFANGNARSLGGNCYQLTGALDWQLGSVWYADPIDLSKDFDLEFYLNFGGKDNSGADGIVFVMQEVSNKAIGKSGGGLGFEGFSPSFGVEFDDFNNHVSEEAPKGEDAPEKAPKKEVKAETAKKKPAAKKKAPAKKAASKKEDKEEK